jgi:hypothetical protein
MNKKELTDIVRKAVKEKIHLSNVKNDDNVQEFTYLRDTLTDLLTDQYPTFINGVDWVAPKPTTFRVNLRNGQYFMLIWNVDDFQAIVAGKKYDLSSLPQQENATKAISRLLYTKVNVQKENDLATLDSGLPGAGAPVPGSLSGGVSPEPGGAVPESPETPPDEEQPSEKEVATI